MIVAVSDFVGEVNIPNPTANTENINLFINKYEPELLGYILGYELYSQYILHPTDQRFVDLVAGKEYVNSCGDLDKWNGIKPLIVNYVYWYYMKDKTTWTSGVGTAISKKNDAVDVSPALKMNRAWNELSSIAKSLYRFLSSQKILYPEYTDNSSSYASWFFGTVNDLDL